MDIWPVATDAESMQSRRDVIQRAAKIAGVVIAAPAIRAAAPMIRLPSERGMLDDEIYRFRAELEDLTHRLETRPPADTLTSITALWTNIEAFHVPHAALSSVRGRVAVLAGVNAITRDDRYAGPRWFDVALQAAQTAGDEELVSYARARRAMSHLYWSRRPADAIVDGTQALIHARSEEQRGLAHMVQARAHADRGQRRHAMAGVDAAVACAVTSGDQYPRPDRWTRAQAYLMGARALSSFGSLLPAVDDHARSALAEAPKDAGHFRAHVWLSVAEARVRGHEYDGAAQAAIGVMTPRLQPVHTNRIRAMLIQANQQNPGVYAMRRVHERLQELATV